jgi:WD40 repeat protein
VWSVHAHRQLGQPFGQSARPGHVTFSPDGTTLATFGDDGYLRMWGARSHQQLGRPIVPQLEPEHKVCCVAFSPDGATLATADDSGNVSLWDVHTHKQLGRPLDAAILAPQDLVFSSDGKTIALASTDATVRWNGILWPDFDYLKNQVCSLALGNLTRDEWEEVAFGVPYHTTC